MIVVQEDTISYVDEDREMFVENFLDQYGVAAPVLIEIEDIIARQSDGIVDFSISDSSITPAFLHTRRVNYIDEDNFFWYGATPSGKLGLCLIKDDGGTSGLIYDYVENVKYYILPANTTESILIKSDISSGHDCGIGYAAPEVNECSENCPGHIHILFLLSNSAQNWLVNTSNYSIYLSLTIAELEIAWANSNIPLSVSYEWDDYNYGSLNILCSVSADGIAGESSVQSLRNAYSADIVVYLAPFETVFSDYLACVAEIGPIDNSAYAVIPVELCLFDFIFAHEIGHLFGAQHKWAPNQIENCAHANDLYFGPYDIGGTILWVGATYRILHYSDPDIFFKGLPTGTATDNNAGRIRQTGCIIADFRQGEKLSANIRSEATLNCKLNLQAIVDIPSDSYTYLWYWSYDGLFTTLYPGTYLGTGATLVVDEPDDDPCVLYFIQLVVKLDSEVIATNTILQRGGICAENVQPCDDDEYDSESRLTTFENQSVNHQQIPGISTFGNVDRLTEKEPFESIDVYTILGEKICSLDDLDLSVSSLRTGMYIIVIHSNDSYQAIKILHHENE